MLPLALATTPPTPVALMTVLPMSIRIKTIVAHVIALMSFNWIWFSAFLNSTIYLQISPSPYKTLIKTKLILIIPSSTLVTNNLNMHKFFIKEWFTKTNDKFIYAQVIANPLIEIILFIEVPCTFPYM